MADKVEGAAQAAESAPGMPQLDQAILAPGETLCNKLC